MKIKLLLLIFLNILVFAFQSNGQAPSILWQKTIGGKDNDSLTSLQITADGGFIACGISRSDIGADKKQKSFGAFDYWVVKMDAGGNIQWSQTLGGAGDDLNPVIIATSDGGYLIGGKSVSAISGTKTEDAYNKSFDYWVVKLDRKGKYIWDNTIGNIQLEYLTGLAETPDGNYLLSGNANSNDGFDKSEKNRGSSLWSDYWVVKIKKNGKILWDKTYGGGNLDVTTCILPVTGGGYVIGGHSYSPAEYEKSDSFNGNNDYWMIKIDENGNEVWDKTYGGVFSDYQMAVDETNDGGFILGGYSNSTSSFNKSGALRGATDFWIIKSTSTGVQKWDKTYGGTGGDYLESIQQTADKGYIMAGYSNSPVSYEKSENTRGGYDGWIIKTDSLGKKQWDKTIGGSLNDRISVVKEISQGEYIVGATSNSAISGEKSAQTVGNNGLNDFWIIRLTSTPGVMPLQATKSDEITTVSKTAPVTKSLSFSVSPNPVVNNATITYSSSINKKISLTIYDLSGKTILKTTLSGSSGSRAVDISNLAAGSYYFMLSNGSSSMTKRVIKE